MDLSTTLRSYLIELETEEIIAKSLQDDIASQIAQAKKQAAMHVLHLMDVDLDQQHDFDYNFHICPICGTNMEYTPYNVMVCHAGCCVYEVDPQGEIVVAKLFNSKYYIIPLYEDAVEEGDRNDIPLFLQEVHYWIDKCESFQTNFPNLFRVVRLRQDQMNQADFIRYFSKKLVAVNLPYELKHNIGPSIIRFLDSVMTNPSLYDFQTDFKELHEIVTRYLSETFESTIRFTRFHPLMNRAEQWSKAFKGNLFIEEIERLTDAQLS